MYKRQELDPARKTVIVGPKSALAKDRVIVNQINWIGPDTPVTESIDVLVKLRSTQEPVHGTLCRGDNDEGRIVLQQKQFGISSGQAAVFYSAEDKSRVLGGGWIVGTELTHKM